MYRKISPVFLQMSKHYKVSDSFVPVRNAFPKSSSLVSSCVGYDQEELKSILNAAVRGMRESASRFEKAYQPRWIGIAPPLEDVAPIGPGGSRSYWASEEYRIWWWENNCGCMRLNSNELYKLPKGQAFFQSTALDGKKATVEYLNNFYEAIASFKGASKRLEKIAEGKEKVAYKDFAHSPSKVAATTKAVKEQYPDRTLVACLELHTYSSLNAEFLKEYEGALEYADVAVVFYSPDAVKIKQLEEVTYEQIAKAFNREDLIIYTNPAEFKTFLFNQNLENSALLLMSSGNYGGLNFDEVKNLML